MIGSLSSSKSEPTQIDCRSRRSHGEFAAHCQCASTRSARGYTYVYTEYCHMHMHATEGRLLVSASGTYSRGWIPGPDSASESPGPIPIPTRRICRGSSGSQYTPTHLTTFILRNFPIRVFRKLHEIFRKRGCHKIRIQIPSVQNLPSSFASVLRLVARRSFRLASPPHGSMHR